MIYFNKLHMSWNNKFLYPALHKQTIVNWAYFQHLTALEFKDIINLEVIYLWVQEQADQLLLFFLIPSVCFGVQAKHALFGRERGA